MWSDYNFDAIIHHPGRLIFYETFSSILINWINRADCRIVHGLQLFFRSVKVILFAFWRHNWWFFNFLDYNRLLRLVELLSKLYCWSFESSWLLARFLPLFLIMSSIEASTFFTVTLVLIEFDNWSAHSSTAALFRKLTRWFTAIWFWRSLVNKLLRRYVVLIWVF